MPVPSFREIKRIPPVFTARDMLRNVGLSYDLAILDTHVLNFMEIKELLSNPKRHLGTIRKYENAEQILIKYAKEVGFRVGCLDLAIWVTMKAARELGI